MLEVKGNKKAGKIASWIYKDATVYLERKKEVCNNAMLSISL